MANNTFPEDWREQPCYIATIPLPLIPYVGGLLKIAEKRGFWATEDDYSRGYTALTELEVCLMTTCLNVLLEKQDALYRLVNTAVFGQSYVIESSEPLIVTPAIEPAVSTDIISYDSIMGRIEDLRQMLDNGLLGTSTPRFDNAPSIRQQLIDVIAAIGDGSDLTEIISDLEGIAILLA